uniref:Uncharacterized protein n=1 Tax=Caenorhabditis japonica TaxID=281687 RepID=A0A8R1ECJ5_CAEJA
MDKKREEEEGKKLRGLDYPSVWIWMDELGVVGGIKKRILAIGIDRSIRVPKNDTIIHAAYSISRSERGSDDAFLDRPEVAL